MKIQEFYHKETGTVTYIVWCQEEKKGAVIDPVLDYDHHSGIYSYKSAEELVSFTQKNSIQIDWILETHIHADHLTSSQFLKKAWPSATLAICHRISEVQKAFSIFLSEKLSEEGSEFDRLLADGDELVIGKLKINCLETPGHTPTCMSFLIEDCLFTGDALFMPDFGTGRCDFPGGEAKTSFHSIQKKLYTLAESTRVFVGHDYGPDGREPQFETSIGESKRSNIRIKAETTEEEFVRYRESRDRKLKWPKLIWPSLQINSSAGALPKEKEGKRFLQIPFRSSL